MRGKKEKGSICDSHSVQLYVFPCDINDHCEYIFFKKKSVSSAVGFPHCAGSGEGLFLSPKPYPHKCVEAGARTTISELKPAVTG